MLFTITPNNKINNKQSARSSASGKGREGSQNVWVRDLTRECVEANPGPGKGMKRRNNRTPVDNDIPKPEKFDIATKSVSIPRLPRTYLFQFRDNTTSTITGNSSAPVAGAWVFSHTNLAQSATLLGLFDQYRFLVADFCFRPRANMEFVGSSATSNTPLIYICPDYDDSNLPPSLSFMLERTATSASQAYKSVRRTIKPHCAIATYSGLFTSFGNVADQWIDSGSPSVAQYGMKWYLPQCNPSYIPVWDIDVIYTLEYRNIL